MFTCTFIFISTFNKWSWPLIFYAFFLHRFRPISHNLPRPLDCPPLHAPTPARLDHGSIPPQFHRLHAGHAGAWSPQTPHRMVQQNRLPQRGHEAHSKDTRRHRQIFLLNPLEIPFTVADLYSVLGGLSQAVFCPGLGLEEKVIMAAVAGIVVPFKAPDCAY